jgi:aryl-alcohol dehydrogenase-like predicted oxidoreductase
MFTREPICASLVVVPNSVLPDWLDRARASSLPARNVDQILTHAPVPPIQQPGVSAALEIERLALGTSGRELPRVALGCGNFGGVGSSPAFFGQGLGEDEAMALMDAAWELGITHFDTADAYGGGRSERAIGRWMAARGVRPTLTTKTFNPMSDDGDRGLAPERVRRQLLSSLERLGVERVDLYLAHDHDPAVPLADSFAAFAAAVASGQVGAYGVSNFNAEQLEQALAVGTPAAVQNSCSLLEQHDLDGVLGLCERHSVSYLAFSPLAGGWLTGKYRRDEPYPDGSRMTQRPEPYAGLASAEQTFDALDALARFAGERGTSMASVALAWLLADRRIAQVVVGPGRPEHLEPVREALAHPLALDEAQRLGKAFS